MKLRNSQSSPVNRIPGKGAGWNTWIPCPEAAAAAHGQFQFVLVTQQELLRAKTEFHTVENDQEKK